MDLLDYNREQNFNKTAPLAARLRPQKLEDFVGQEHIVGENTMLYRAIKTDKLSSIVLYGPPGCGKTTLAKIIANTTKSIYKKLNATTSGIKDIKEIVENAKTSLGMCEKKTILFVDEIHRFNKAQQDALLPHVEEGTVILIGATTENPYFEVNKALLSRSIIFQFKNLTKIDIEKIVNRAITDTEKGFGDFNIEIKDDALSFICGIANGDARNALNAIELAVLSTDKVDNKIVIDLNVAEQCIQKRALNYDKNGDNHYDTISAFIKSMRGSDPQAAVYYLARMLYAGEDPKFIARRIVIAASEDVGNADPHALQVAVAAAQATDFIGMPECRIILSQAAIYVASAPKSNASYFAIDAAFEDVKNVQIKTIPPYLKDGHYSGAVDLGNSIGYKYSHDFPLNYVNQQYLPDELVDSTYYVPTTNGIEKKIGERLDYLKSL